MNSTKYRKNGKQSEQPVQAHEQSQSMRQRIKVQQHMPHALQQDLSNPVSKIPIEILMHIFQHVKSQDLLFHVAKVCRYWRLVALEPSLWRSRELDDSDVLLNDLNLLALAPTFKKVSLQTNFAQDLVVKALLHGNKDLLHLKLHFCEGSLSVTQLRKLLPAFPNLELLDLQLPSASHDQELFSAFHPLTKLESLRLTGFVAPLPELLFAITNYCYMLHSLHLVDCLIFFRDEHLIALVSNGRPWKSLKLMTYFISEAAYNYFASVETLMNLALVKCKSLTEENLIKIATLPCLTALKISENCLISSNALSTCFQSQAMASLTDIDLMVYR